MSENAVEFRECQLIRLVTTVEESTPFDRKWAGWPGALDGD